MEFPPYASEPEAKTLIDKLAVFVARNGREFEKMTRNKQRNNPRFAFLFGGKYCSYYQHQVSAEIKKLRQQGNGSNEDAMTSNVQPQQGNYPPQQLQAQPYGAPPPQTQQQQQISDYPAAPQQSAQTYGVPPHQPAQGYGAPPEQPAQSYVAPPQQLAQSYGMAAPPPPQLDSLVDQQQRTTISSSQQPPQTTGAFGTAARAAPQSYLVSRQEATVPGGHHPTARDSAPPVQAAPGPEHDLAALSRQTGLSVEQLAGVLEPLVAEETAGVGADGGATSDKQAVLLASYLLKRVRAGGSLVQQAAAAREKSAAASSPSNASETPQQAPPTKEPSPEAAPSAAAHTGAPASASDQTGSGDTAAHLADIPADPTSKQAWTNPADDGEPGAKRPRVEDVPAGEDKAVVPAAEESTEPQPAEATPTTESASAASGTSGQIKKSPQISEIAQLQRTVKDPDALFALSVAEALKSLPMEQKVTLRIKIMEAVSSSRDTASRPPPVKTPPKAQAAVAALARAIMSAQKSNTETAKADLPPEVDVSRPPPSMASAEAPANGQPPAAAIDDFSEEFFIGNGPKDPEPDVPQAPPVKTQRVSRSAPFADQIEDAKARAAAIARLAASEPAQSAGQGTAMPPQAQFQQLQTGYNYGQQVGAPAAPGNGAGQPTPPQWWQQAASGAQPPPAGYQAAPAPGVGPQQYDNAAMLRQQQPPQQQQQYQQQQYQPTNQPPPSLIKPLQMPFNANYLNNTPAMPQPNAQDPGLQLGLGMTVAQIQEKIQLLQQLTALQERQQGQQSLEQLQMQAAAMVGGVPEKTSNWDQRAAQQLQQLQQQAQQEMPTTDGNGLPMPTAAMPQSRGGPRVVGDRKFRSPPGHFRR